MAEAVYNLYEAKSSLSRLVERAARGEEIIIAKAGKPVAKLVSVSGRIKRRKPGGWKGKVLIADDFDAPLPRSIQAAFEGRRRRDHVRAQRAQRLRPTLTVRGWSLGVAQRIAPAQSREPLEVVVV